MTNILRGPFCGGGGGGGAGDDGYWGSFDRTHDHEKMRPDSMKAYNGREETMM